LAPSCCPERAQGIATIFLILIRFSPLNWSVGSSPGVILQVTPTLVDDDKKAFVQFNKVDVNGRAAKSKQGESRLR